MTHTVKILRRAEHDLREVQRYVETTSPGMSGTIIDGLLAAMAALAVMPLRGARPADGALRRAGYRFLVRSPYRTFYKVKGRSVTIYRVLHGRRAWTKMLR